MSGTNEYCKCDLKYQELSPIDVKHLRQIKLCFIFATSESTDIIFITNSDEVYGFGTNYRGRLGFGHSTYVKKPTFMVELNGKSIKTIESGLAFMCALTEYGDVYAWGQETGGQLGNGRDSNGYCKPQKVSLNNLVTEIKCFDTGTILLSNSQIYWYGQDHNYDWGLMVASTPTHLSAFSDEEMTGIACGDQHILATTITGKVYGWDSNCHGQLGLGHSSFVTDPQLIPLPDAIFIKAMSCGNHHSLLLTTDGDIYSFGYNSCGQLGTGDMVNKKSPFKLELQEKSKDIFAFEDLSMALTATQNIVVWGQTNQRAITTPFKTEFRTFQEAINFYNTNIITYKPLSFADIFVKIPIKPVMDTMAKAFNDQQYSDLKFKIKSKENKEYKYIFGHKWFVAKSSEYFERMFANKCSESETNEIELTELGRCV